MYIGIDKIDYTEKALYLNTPKEGTKPFLLKFWTGSGPLLDTYVVFAVDEEDAKTISFELLVNVKPQIILDYEEVRALSKEIMLEEHSEIPNDSEFDWEDWHYDLLDEYIYSMFIGTEDADYFCNKDNFCCQEIKDKEYLQPIYDNFIGIMYCYKEDNKYKNGMPGELFNSKDEAIEYIKSKGLWNKIEEILFKNGYWIYDIPF